MAVLTRPKTVSSKKNRKKIDAAKATSQAGVPRSDRSHEAPDRGMRPELREAPDAGESRAGYVEAEFTHGRSQS